MWKADEYHSASDNTEPPLIKSFEHVLNTTALAILPSSSSSLSLQDLVLGWVGTSVDFTLKRLFKKIHHLGEVTSATSKNFESCPSESLPTPDSTCGAGTRGVEWQEKIPSKPLASLVGIDNEFTNRLWLSPWECLKSRHFTSLIVSQLNIMDSGRLCKAPGLSSSSPYPRTELTRQILRFYKVLAPPPPVLWVILFCCCDQ